MKPPESKLAAARALLASLNRAGKSAAVHSSADPLAANRGAVGGGGGGGDDEDGDIDVKGAGGGNVVHKVVSNSVSSSNGGARGASGARGGNGAAGMPRPLSDLAKLAELRASKTYSGLSLKARALKMLALRDLSSAELRRKLRAVVTATPEMGKTVDDVDELLADFTARGWQSDARFAEQLARRRSKFGNARLAQELKSHGLDKTTVAGTLDAASGSEYARALAAWQKKFDAPATTAKDRAKQGRFLAARGFSADVMRKVLRQAGAEPEDEE